MFCIKLHNSVIKLSSSCTTVTTRFSSSCTTVTTWSVCILRKLLRYYFHNLTFQSAHLVTRTRRTAAHTSVAHTRAHESYTCPQTWPWITGFSRFTKGYRIPNARLNGMGHDNGVSVRPIEINVIALMQYSWYHIQGFLRSFLIRLCSTGYWLCVETLTALLHDWCQLTIRQYVKTLKNIGWRTSSLRENRHSCGCVYEREVSQMLLCTGSLCFALSRFTLCEYRTPNLRPLKFLWLWRVCNIIIYLRLFFFSHFFSKTTGAENKGWSIRGGVDPQLIKHSVVRSTVPTTCHTRIVVFLIDIRSTITQA